MISWFPMLAATVRLRVAALIFTAVLPSSARSGAQQPNAAPSVPSQTPEALKSQLSKQQNGLETPWDVQTILAALTKDQEVVRPLLTELNPQQWYEKKGAPTGYILQWQTAQRQLNDVTIATKLLSQRTDSLSLALDDYFRMEALGVTLGSLDEGARKYADRPTADKLSEFVSRSFNDRERLRDYIRDLAASTEQNYKIADEEAQRCRGIISKEPPAASQKARKH